MESVKAERSKAAAATATAGAQRRPLAPSEKNNAAPAGRRTESPSRFKPVSVSPAAPAAPPAPAAPASRRCGSPSPGCASADGSSATCTRARSAAAPSPAASSRLKPSAAARSASAVPPRDAAADGHSTPPRARKAKDSVGPWASARTSCSSPLLRPEAEHGQSPASKVDRLVRGLPSEPVVRLRPGAVAERKTSPRPRTGSTNNTGDRSQHENARPPESPANSVALADKHWWPGMMTTGRGRGSAGLSSTTAASAEKASRSDASSSSDASTARSPRRTRPCEGAAATGKSVRRRPSSETAKTVHRRRKDKAADSSSDTSSQTSESSRPTSCRPTKDVSLPVPVLHRSSSPRPPGGLSAASSTTSRSCQTPSRMRPSAAPCQSKCASSAARTVVEQPAFTYYIVDARKGKKNACQIENVHQLRLLSSRYLQWRFVNAHSEETLSHRKSVESILYNVWRSISTLRDAVTITRTSVRRLQQQVKLYGILTEQIGYLEQWPELEEECNDTLVEATEALKASTLRLPVTSGAQADGIAIRNAISSAVDVMQALSSSIYYVQSKVEDRTSLVSELSATAREEKVALDQCRELLATAAKLQVQETSLRTLLMQLRQRSAG